MEVSLSSEFYSHTECNLWYLHSRWFDWKYCHTVHHRTRRWRWNRTVDIRTLGRIHSNQITKSRLCSLLVRVYFFYIFMLHKFIPTDAIVWNSILQNSYENRQRKYTDWNTKLAFFFAWKNQKEKIDFIDDSIRWA